MNPLPLGQRGGSFTRKIETGRADNGQRAQLRE